jgi:hypothetical protein
MQFFPDDFYQFLQQNTLIGIKAGFERPSFLNIWMVNVEKRVFARSWEKSEKGWFSTLTQLGEGEIQYQNKVLKIKAIRLEADLPIHILINKAYLEKYQQPNNLFYAKGITQPEYHHFTVELFLKN